MAIISHFFHAIMLASSLATVDAAAMEPRSIDEGEILSRGDDFITHCPGTLGWYNSPHGNQYRPCNNTNYVGPDTVVVPNIQTHFYCWMQCSIRTGCPKVSWNRETLDCHIKAREEPTNSWVEDDRFYSAFNPRFIPTPEK